MIKFEISMPRKEGTVDNLINTLAGIPDMLRCREEAIALVKSIIGEDGKQDFVVTMGLCNQPGCKLNYPHFPLSIKSDRPISDDSLLNMSRHAPFLVLTRNGNTIICKYGEGASDG